MSFRSSAVTSTPYFFANPAAAGVASPSGLKAAVAEYYQTQGSFTGADSGQGGIPPAATGAGKYVNTVTVDTGVITATMNGSGVANCVSGKTVTLTPAASSQDAPISWTCDSNATSGCKPSTCTG